MTRRFLLVDDDADDASLFCEASNRIQSIECFTAENGVELFNLLPIHHINPSDIIFLDINMPMMDGWACLKKLKASADYNSIPVIMYSTSSAKKDIDKAYQLGAQLFLTKPEDFRELIEILALVAVSPQHALLSKLKGFKNVQTI